MVQSIAVDDAADALAKLPQLNSVQEVVVMLDDLIRRRGLERYIRSSQGRPE